MKIKNATKTALTLTVCFMLAWTLLGTHATVAWFTDTADTAKNTFVIGDMHLKVKYKNDLVTQYAPLKPDTPLFVERAIYEPGYTQVVYLQVENAGDVDFDYKLAVNVLDYNTSINALGVSFCLPPYLRFGVCFGADEADLDRQVAQQLAQHKLDDYKLNSYSQPDPVTVLAGDIRYVALVLYMPTWVGNEANGQKGARTPKVELGVTVFAQQAGTGLR